MVKSMAKTLDKTGEVIDAIGDEFLAKICGRTVKAVNNWRWASSLPADTHLPISKALKAIGLVADEQLWAVRRKRSERRVS